MNPKLETFWTHRKRPREGPSHICQRRSVYMKPYMMRLTCFLSANKRGALSLLINTQHAHQILCVGQQVCRQRRRHELKCSKLCCVVVCFSFVFCSNLRLSTTLLLPSVTLVSVMSSSSSMGWYLHKEETFHYCLSRVYLN